MLNHGYRCLSEVITPAQAEEILAELAQHPASQRGGMRNAEQKLPKVKQLIKSIPILSIVRESMEGETNHPISFVRALIFDKSAANNWRVSWHQDRTIAVSKRIDIEGWGPWSIKDGIHHVQPSVDVLQKMVTLRIHLDPATSANGCLMILPNTHQDGLLDRDAVKHHVEKQAPVHCEGGVGSAVVMSPLLLHASCKASNDKPRRILHIEYSQSALPAGLNWV